MRIIALFKFGKVLLLIATSYGVHKLLNAALVERLYNWSAELSDDRFERKLLMRALEPGSRASVPRRSRYSWR